MEVRIGELLVEAGVLTERQVHSILSQQEQTGEPFGLLSERMFAVDSTVVEDAWVQQYARLTRTVDPAQELFEEQATQLVTRRQAWQFRSLPIRFDGRELMLATIQPYLRRALGFATNVIGVPIYLVLTKPACLGEAMCRIYPMPGMTPQSVSDNRMDELLAMVNR